MKFIKLLDKEFMSTSYETWEFKEFVSAFKKDIKDILKPYIDNYDIEFHKGHFEISCMVKLNTGQIWYLSIGDVRWDKKQMLVRTAEHFKDWTGGPNGFVTLDENFKTNLLNRLGVDEE
jgi:hypothetical protein